MKKYNAVVVGAGNGGICAALALAQAGLKPLVIERHNLAGGCAGSFVRGRFEFDISLHTLEYDTMFKPTFEGKMHLTETFPRVKPGLCNVYFENGEPKVEYYRCTEDLPEQVEAKHPGNGRAFGRLMKTTKSVMEAFSELTGSEKPNFPKIVLKHPAFLRYAQKSVQQVIEAHKAPQYAGDLFSTYWWYGGEKPAKLPFAVYSVMSYSAFAGNVNFPEHTAHGYLAQVEAEIRKLGGDIWFNPAVTKINTKNGAVCSVETDRGDVIETNAVLCNINPGVVFDRMLTGADDLAEKYAGKYAPIKENFSFMTIYLGLDASAEEIGIKDHHCFINENRDLNYVYDCCGSWDGPKTIGVNCPNITIPGFSPEGTSIVTISVPVLGSVLEGLSQKEYVKKKREFELEYVEKVERYLGIDLRSHIEEIDSMTPATLVHYAGLYNGALGVLLDWENMSANRAVTAELNKGAVKGLSFTGQFAGNLGYQNSVEGYKVGEQVAKTVRGVK